MVSSYAKASPKKKKKKQPKLSNEPIFTGLPISLIGEVPNIPEKVNIPSQPVQNPAAAVPPYPDKGISYAGFSKRPVGNSYKIVPQKPLSVTVSYSGWGAFYVNAPAIVTPDTYIMRITITGTIQGADVGTYMGIGFRSNLIAYFQLTADLNKVLEFAIPRNPSANTTSEGFYVSLPTASAAASTIYVTFEGFIEEI